MSYTITRIWREPHNHVKDCYFCIVDILRLKKMKNLYIVYPDVPSSIALIKHSDELSVLRPPAKDLESKSEGEYF